MKRVMGWLLIGWSIFMLFIGADTMTATSGTVHGTEFGMLISIARILGILTVWVGLFGMWTVAPVKAKNAET